MAQLSSTTASSYLGALGFRGAYGTRVANFQRGWNLGTALVVDGLYGPKTDAALRVSDANRRAGRGTASAHFSFSEFTCKCGGRYSSCAGTWVLRTHIQRLEAYRTHVGPVVIVSGCRCYYHNRAVGGASSSQHLYGGASDISGLVSLSTMRGYRLFAGIGYKGSTGRVLHVDSRDKSGHNTTGSNTSSPSTWVYA